MSSTAFSEEPLPPATGTPEPACFKDDALRCSETEAFVPSADEPLQANCVWQIVFFFPRPEMEVLLDSKLSCSHLRVLCSKKYLDSLTFLVVVVRRVG